MAYRFAEWIGFGEMCIVQDAIVPLVLGGARLNDQEWPRGVLLWAAEKLRWRSHSLRAAGVKELSESKSAEYFQAARDCMDQADAIYERMERA